MADPLAGFDVRDLPGDVQRALGIMGARSTDGAAGTGSLWVPPRFNITGAPEPSEYVATSRFPRRLLGQQRMILQANTGMFGGDGWPVHANGTVSISCVFSAAAKLQVSLDGGRTWAPLGAALTAGQMAGPSAVQVAAGDRIDFSASAAVTATFVRVLYVADIASGGGGGGGGPVSQGPAAAITAPWPVELSDGTAAVGTASNPLSVAQVQGTLTDHSGTLGAVATSQQVMAANSSRRYLYVQNPSSADTLWINFTTAATQAQPSIQMLPGGSFVMEGSFVSTEAVNIIGPTAGDAFIAKEG